MGKKLDEEEIEQAIAENWQTSFDTCCVCGGVEEGRVMHEVDNDSFDVCCDECKDLEEAFEEWIEDGNVIEFKDGFATQDAHCLLYTSDAADD